VHNVPCACDIVPDCSEKRIKNQPKTITAKILTISSHQKSKQIPNYAMFLKRIGIKVNIPTPNTVVNIHFTLDEKCIKCYSTTNHEERLSFTAYWYLEKRYLKKGDETQS